MRKIIGGVFFFELWVLGFRWYLVLMWYKSCIRSYLENRMMEMGVRVSCLFEETFWSLRIRYKRKWF